MTERSGPGRAAELLAQEPFFAAFHRRHPDVDIVLLPRPAAAADPAPAVGLDDLRRLAAATERAYASLRPLLPPDLPDPTRSWRPAGDLWAFTVRKALRGLAGSEARALQHRLGAELHRRGWRVWGRPSGDVVVLRAGNGWLDLEVRSGAAATSLVVASPPVVVAADDLDLLRAEARRDG
ncbi:hypothetical protein RDV89_04410 [Nocardioides zeae]|uniref:Uncharacterized protein n=1 Tax=Nocardioides imazamoxiresistens TaxID=3231893 RepID=A0ABU3PSW7_9ACTN|nr:hypothetical protein [Nocardioides zeae]MDT9592294.1 hypothetical protein [Nocardioides zeae]